MKNFIFDLYGTLVDIRTDESSDIFWNKFSKYLSKRFHARDGIREQYCLYMRQTVGDAEPDVCDVLQRAVTSLGGRGRNIGVRAAKAFRRLSTKYIRLYDGAKSLLKLLKNKGVKIYLLSNAQRAFTIDEIKRLHILKYFDGILLSSDFGYKKPSISIFEHLIKTYNLDCGESIYIGNDIRCDILPAKSLGLKTAYIRSNISPQSDEISKEADFATDNFYSLINFLIAEALC